MKTRIAGALALLASTGMAQAQSALTIYGDVDEYLGYIHSSNGEHITGLNDGAILRTRLGVRGSEALGQGYEVKYNLEMGIGADTGTQADSSRLFDRQAWVGMNTPAGEVRVGRQNTEIFLTGGPIDYTERTTFGSVINTFGVPSRYDNDISYRTPRVAGLMLSLHYALPENGGATRGNRPVYQAALDYEKGPFRLGYAGLQATPNRLTATVPDKVSYQHLYANYKYDAGTVYLAFVRSNNSTGNANGRNAATILSNVGSPNNYFAGTDPNAGRYYNIWQISADYRVTPALRVGALYGVMHDTSGGDAGARGANAGAYYAMSKRTTLYSFLSYLKNEANAGFRFSSSAAPSANLAGDAINGRRLTGLQLGILHRF
ncbi:porin [Massilia litorea]|uniref:Porin n=1 Tax=Massilia litorea TaxID=2769491 RepID=A0A7L9UBC4_9BURK|nr:porin [Massilia litorea]QOL52110.1 porin [Massilia litorea]